ncbi:hypothetical protein [uncultured Bifidobacterium sp.]|uniref:hypothetical protein n=1 Tax=uncultured Bifidobacterium sp. TaxID=165187 RepID=UPI00261F9778|nr:hypothetical protein [uncultured Bifidobacterium sp.]
MGIIGDLANKYLGIGDGFKDLQKDLIDKADNISDGEKNSLKADIDRTGSATPSNWASSKGPTVANKPKPEPTPTISSYSPTAGKAQWQNDLEDFIGNQVSKWADNVKSTYTPENVSSAVSDAFEPLGEVVSDNIPVVSQLEQAKENKAERKAYEGGSGIYEYLNDLVDEDEEDPSYNGLTYGQATEAIAQKLVDDPTTTLSDREKDIIRNRSDSWKGEWSLPYIAASDKAYRKSYNDRASEELGEEAALLKPQTFDVNIGPVSWGAQDDNAMDSNTNYGFYIDPDDAAQVLGEYNYQPYNSTDDGDWAYAFGTDGGWGKNYVGEMANNVNNFFNNIGEARQRAAKDAADNGGQTITLADGTRISMDDMKNSFNLAGLFYDPDSVTEAQKAALDEAGAQPIEDRDSSQMTAVYNLLIGADGSILPGNFDFETADVSPDGTTFTVSGGTPFDGTYNVSDFTKGSVQSVAASADELGLSDEDAASLASSVPAYYWIAQADPTSAESVLNNAQDVSLPGGGTITAQDFLDYQEGKNVSQNDSGPFNIWKQYVDMPWSNGADLNTWAENIVPWFVDTGLQSLQTLGPWGRFLGPVWGGGRAIAEVQGLDPNQHIRGDVDVGGGYTKQQQALRAVGDLADPFIEQLGGQGSTELAKLIPGIKNLNKAVENRPVAKFLADTAGEGVEEVATGLVQQLGQTPEVNEDMWRDKVYNPVTKTYQLDQDDDPNEKLWENVSDNFLGGAVFSAPLNAGHSAVDYAKNKNDYKEKRDEVFHPRRTKASKSEDYNLDDSWKSYYDQYLEDMEG